MIYLLNEARKLNLAFRITIPLAIHKMFDTHFMDVKVTNGQYHN